MSFNIVDLVKDQISDQLLGQMGSVLGIDSKAATGALSGALPGLLDGLVGSARNPAGAGVLFDAISKQDDGLLGNLGNLLGGDQSAQVIDQGNSVLGSLLGGGALGKLADVIGSFSGIGRGVSGSMLGMLAPLVLGVIKKQFISENHADAGGLASMLMGQQDNINAAMPEGFANQLQSSGFFDSISPGTPSMDAPSDSAAPQVPAQAESAVDSARTAVVDAGDSSGGMMKWLLPLVAIAVLGYLGMKFMGGNRDADVTGAVNDATSAAGDAVNEAGETAGDAVDAAANFDLATAQETLSGAFNDASDALTSVTDAESAQAALPQLESVEQNVSGLAAMLENVPDTARAPLQSIAQNGLARLQPLADKVLGLPGVGDVLGPVVGSILQGLGSIGG